MIDNNSIHHGDGHSHSAFDNPEMFAERFDSPERDEWQKPNEVIESFHLSDNATVAEIGAGTGYFAVRLARHLKNGTVIALDEAPQMVAYLKKRATELGLMNVDARPANVDGRINLQEKLDLIMCVDAYHHISDRVSYFSNLIKHLNEGGKLVVIDRAENAPAGPPPAYRVPPEAVIKEMGQAGFGLTDEADFLLPYQFYLAFKPVDLDDKST